MSERKMLISLLLAGVAALGQISPAQGQTMRTLTSSRQIWSTEPMAVEVEYGAGTLDVERESSGSLLYRMEMRYDEERVTPVAEFDSAARMLRLGSRQHEGARGRMREGSRMEIALTDRVPLDLGLHFGAGEAEIDLGGVRLRRLELETGASETTVRFDEPNPIRAEEVQLKAGAAELRVIGLGNLRAERIHFQGGVGSTTLDFSGAWERSAAANVQMGVGELVLRFPRSVGVRINRSSFLTSFDADRFEQRDGAYFSDNWQSAAHQLTVDVDAAFGSVEIEWIDE